jgi:hypothetical protein
MIYLPKQEYFNPISFQILFCSLPEPLAFIRPLKIMKTKYLTPFYLLSIICLFSILGMQNLAAQDWSLQIGINATNYRYYSPSSPTINSYQPDAGLHLSFSQNKPLFTIAKTKSAFFRKLSYHWGLSINQFNSLGETQNIPFSYSTTFAGIKTGVGMQSKLGKGYSLSYSSTLQLNKLLLGNQKMGSQVFNLQGNHQFDRIQFLLGAEIRGIKQVNNQTAIFLFLANSWQLNTIQNDGNQFAINPSSLGLGVQYFIQK